MPVLDRAQGAIYYDVCDIVPPWNPAPETIVFLNGLAIDAGIWADWLPKLAARFRLVRVELRGFGRSFVPTPGATWAIEDIAEDVLDVVAALGGGPVHFVGESTGGTVGLYLAAHHRESLRTLTTVSAAHRGDSIQRARALRDEVTSLGMDAWSSKLMPLRFHPGGISPAMHEWFHEVQRGCAPSACADLVDMLVAVDLTDCLPDLTTPTLILAPDDSPFVSVEAQIERLRLIPGAKLHVVANARHGVTFSHGRECARALRDFIDGIQ